MFILLVKFTSKSPTAALETWNSELDTSSKVSTWTSKGKVLVVERVY